MPTRTLPVDASGLTTSGGGCKCKCGVVRETCLDDCTTYGTWSDGGCQKFSQAVYEAAFPASATTAVNTVGSASYTTFGDWNTVAGSGHPKLTAVGTQTVIGSYRGQDTLQNVRISLLTPEHAPGSSPGDDDFGFWKWGVRCGAWPVTDPVTFVTTYYWALWWTDTSNTPTLLDTLGPAIVSPYPAPGDSYRLKIAADLVTGVVFGSVKDNQTGVVTNFSGSIGFAGGFYSCFEAASLHNDWRDPAHGGLPDTGNRATEFCLNCHFDNTPIDAPPMTHAPAGTGLGRKDRCEFLLNRTEFKSGCGGLTCRHGCSKGLPAVPGKFCQTCPEYIPETGVAWSS